MAEFKRIDIDQIAIPERLRAVEEEHALAIAQSIIEHGLLNPITVRSTPAANKGKTPYTLVAGAHRLRAVQINDDSEIEAIVIEADKEEAQLVEIVENVFRNELSVMDRAIFVQSYRDIWEAKFGKVEPGRPHNRINLIQLIGEENKTSTFAEHVADRMGISVPSYKRLNQISQNLTPKLREKLRGTPAADNQSLLLKLSSQGPTEQAKIAAGLEKADLPTVLAALAPPKPKPTEADKQQAAKASLFAAWEKADAISRSLFIMDRLIEAGADADLARQVKDLLMRASK